MLQGFWHAKIKLELKRVPHVKRVFGFLDLHISDNFHKHYYTLTLDSNARSIMHARFERQKKFLLALNFAFQNFKPMHKNWVVTPGFFAPSI
jgi:hypothetical protein